MYACNRRGPYLRSSCHSVKTAAGRVDALTYISDKANIPTSISLRDDDLSSMNKSMAHFVDEPEASRKSRARDIMHYSKSTLASKLVSRRQVIFIQQQKSLRSRSISNPTTHHTPVKLSQPLSHLIFQGPSLDHRIVQAKTRYSRRGGRRTRPP